MGRSLPSSQETSGNVATSSSATELDAWTKKNDRNVVERLPSWCPAPASHTLKQKRKRSVSHNEKEYRHGESWNSRYMRASMQSGFHRTSGEKRTYLHYINSGPLTIYCARLIQYRVPDRPHLLLIEFVTGVRHESLPGPPCMPTALPLISTAPSNAEIPSGVVQLFGEL